MLHIITSPPQTDDVATELIRNQKCLHIVSNYLTHEETSNTDKTDLMPQLYNLSQMLCVKIINMYDGILKALLNPRDYVSITLMEDGLNQSSTFIYSHMNGAIESRLRESSTFTQQLFFSHIRQITSDAITNHKAFQRTGIYLPLIIAMPPVFNFLFVLASNQVGHIISLLLMFIKYI